MFPWIGAGRRARRWLASVPSLLVIVETELWPNLLRAAQEAGARVVMVNARMSKRSLRGYRLARPFMRRVLANVDEICAQTEEDAERFRQLGAKPERVRMVGNLKFDAQPPQLGEFARALKAALRQAQRGPVLVAASTMPGEEPLVLEAWDLIQARYPKALLILAPRHPARFEEVSQDLARAQRGFVRRTALPVEEQGVIEPIGFHGHSPFGHDRRVSGSFRSWRTWFSLVAVWFPREGITFWSPPTGQK